MFCVIYLCFVYVDDVIKEFVISTRYKVNWISEELVSNKGKKNKQKHSALKLLFKINYLVTLWKETKHCNQAAAVVVPAAEGTSMRDCRYTGWKLHSVILKERCFFGGEARKILIGWFCFHITPFIISGSPRFILWPFEKRPTMW